MKLAALKAAEYNPREISEKAAKGLRASIKRFGLVQPIVWNKRTKRVVGGHQRVTALRALGRADAQVVIVDLPETEEKALNVTLNNPAIEGEFSSALGGLIAGIKASLPAPDFAELGFDELEDAPIAVEDEVPEPPNVAVTKPGDLWKMGDHRLLCGNSGSIEELDRLLEGGTIHLLNTDPPYNVKVEPRSNNAIAAGLSSHSKPIGHHQAFDLARRPGTSKPTGKMRARDRPLQNDFITAADFDLRLREWFANAARVLPPGHAFYIWGGFSNWKNYPAALAETGLEFHHGIIWVKGHPVMTRKDFMGNHECCFYGWREGGAHRWFGPHNATDVWEVKKINPAAMVHLTEKPVELAARALRYSSQEGEIVLDLFGGSGSTMSAAAQLNRRAMLMEIDPAYCDVIVERWQALTGQKATR